MAALQAALAKFRSRAVVASNVKEAGRKEREEKIQQKAAAEAKQAERKTGTKRPRAKSNAAATSSAASDGGASGSGVAGGATSWKTLPLPQALEPLGMRRWRVIEFLRGVDGPQSVEDVLQGTGRDLRVEADLVDSLATHPNVSVSEDGTSYVYRSNIQAKNRTELLKHIQTSDKPVTVKEISDAYVAAKQDVESLVKEGHVWALHSYDLQEDVLFPVDPRLAALRPVGGELADLWVAQQLPDDDEDMAAELRKIGLKPAPRKAPRRRMPSERKKKARKQQRIRNVTNVHLMDTGIFEGEAPTQID
ncbi:hypothetical protein N2152v2_004138 [Parachlorella kessleri]